MQFDYNYIFSTLIWFYIPVSIYLCHNLSWKVVSNITSTIHASTVVMFYLIGINFEILFYSSCGYYIFDGCLNIYYYYKNKNSGYLFMIVHHIATVFTLTYLYNPVCTDTIFKNFFLLELSNYPLYIVYHLKSVKYDNQYVVGFFIFLEAVASIVCRLILGTMNLYRVYSIKDFPWTPLLMGVLIYIISILWLKAILKQIYQIFFSKHPHKKELSH